VIISAYQIENVAMITRVCCVIRPEGSDLIFDHPYNAESALENRQLQAARATRISAIPVRSLEGSERG
jgi:hypothetical protein